MPNVLFSSLLQHETPPTQAMIQAKVRVGEEEVETRNGMRQR